MRNWFSCFTVALRDPFLWMRLAFSLCILFVPWLILNQVSQVSGGNVQTLFAPPAVADAAFQSPACPPHGLTIDGKVLRVIDGDTIVVESRVEYHVRLLDCWAPESRTTDAAEKARGLKSKARMKELADGRSVRVFFPAGGGDLTDAITMGRILGRVWRVDDSGVPERDDLSSVMVRERLATPSKVSE